MKKVLLFVVVSAAVVALGFAQTPDASSNTDQVNIQGCLGGSDGNYTVAEDGSGQIFKITTSTVDLTSNIAHRVKLIGHKATEAGVSADNFVVTELNMISENCAAAAGALNASVSPASDTVIAPAATGGPSSTPATPPSVGATAAASTVNPSSAPVTTPAAGASQPSAVASPSSAPISTPAMEVAATANPAPAPAPIASPAVEAAQPSTTVSPSSEPITPPTVDAGGTAADTTHPTRPSAHPRKQAATQAASVTEPAAAVSPSPETVNPPAADADTHAATASPSPETANPAGAASATSTATTHKSELLWLLILFGVLVIGLGTLVPLLGRWRKRRLLERTGTQNLSFTNEAIPNEDKPEPRKVA